MSSDAMVFVDEIGDLSGTGPTIEAENRTCQPHTLELSEIYCDCSELQDGLNIEGESSLATKRLSPSTGARFLLSSHLRNQSIIFTR